MITPTQIYWLTRFDEIKELTSDFAKVSIALCVILIIWGLMLNPLRHDHLVDDTIREKTRKIIKTFFILAPCFLLVSIGLKCVDVFVPTTKETAAIYVIPKLANSEAVQKLPSIASTVVDLAEDWLKELKPTKERK